MLKRKLISEVFSPVESGSPGRPVRCKARTALRQGRGDQPSHFDTRKFVERLELHRGCLAAKQMRCACPPTMDPGSRSQRNARNPFLGKAVFHGPKRRVRMETAMSKIGHAKKERDRAGARVTPRDAQKGGQGALSKRHPERQLEKSSGFASADEQGHGVCSKER